MTAPWIAALAALFLWWFSTGAILLVVRHADSMGRRANTRCVLAALPVLGLGIWGALATRDAVTPMGAYGAFVSALALWGWIEMTFLTGLVTGPNLRPCPPHVPEWERFVRAWGTVAYHEMLLAGMLLLLWLHGQGAPNTVALQTFTLLFAARISAKLNLYLGVPRINTEFLPRALGHLSSHFRISRLNWLFPLSIIALSVTLAYWLVQLAAAQSASAIVGHALLAAITGLALLEHWLMVLPLPDAKLWRWMLPAPAQQPEKTKPEGHHGF